MRTFLTFPLVAFLLAACPHHAAADEAEDNAALEIEKLGGKLVRQDPDKRRTPVTEVYLDGVDKAAEALAYVNQLKQLQFLHLNRTKITDKNLELLKPLDKLELLDLNETKITDQGLE